MAQVTDYSVVSGGFEAKNENITVALASNTDLLEVFVHKVARMTFEVKNDGGNAFDAFIVQGKMHPGGNYVNILSAAGDYTTPAGIVVDASGDLTTLAAGATGWLIIDVIGFYQVKIQASSAVGTTTCDVYARGA